MDDPRLGSASEDHFSIAARIRCVRGKVVTEGGRGVAGRKVRAHSKDLQENRYYDPTVTTQEDGSFELKFIRPGDNWIQVEPFYLSAAGAPSGSIVVTLEEGQLLEDVELTLPRLQDF